MIHHAAGRTPIEGAVLVIGRDKAGARVKHFVLRVPRTELRADGVPASLQQLDLVLGIEVRRPLRLVQDQRQLGIGSVTE